MLIESLPNSNRPTSQIELMAAQMDTAKPAPHLSHLVSPSAATATSSQHPRPYLGPQYYPVHHVREGEHFTPQSIPGYPPPVPLYEHLRPPFPIAMYPTPPIQSNPVGIPAMQQHPMSVPPPAAVQVPNLQPLTVYTERQACTALSPPSDMTKYGKSFQGLLMTTDGSVGGRASPAAATEASPGGAQHGEKPNTPARKKRTHDDDGVGGGGKSAKKARFSFSETMLETLEQRFALGRYITAEERRVVAAKLGIADVQVKNWFQNRRMKWKRQCATNQPAPACSSTSTKRDVDAQRVTSTLSTTVTAGNHCQTGNVSSTHPIPLYTTSIPYTAPSLVTQRISPNQLVSNAGIPTMYPRTTFFPGGPGGYAYSVPFSGDAGYGIQADRHDSDPTPELVVNQK